MICPNCKNEYLEKTVCPVCGLDELAALKAVADTTMGQERYDLAINALSRYLGKVPGDPEMSKKLATCHYLLARMLLHGPETQKAYERLGQALNLDWGWEMGHQYRIHLADRLSLLEALEEDYRRHKGSDDPIRDAIADRMIHVIQLTRQYKWQLPEVPLLLLQPSGWERALKVYWPLLFGIVWVTWTAQGFLEAIQAERPLGGPLAFMVTGVLLSVMMFLYTVSSNSKTGKRTRHG